MPYELKPLPFEAMYEHSYHIDFGAKAGEYVEAFMRNIDWEKVNARHVGAVE